MEVRHRGLAFSRLRAWAEVLRPAPGGKFPEASSNGCAKICASRALGSEMGAGQEWDPGEKNLYHSELVLPPKLVSSPWVKNRPTWNNIVTILFGFPVGVGGPWVECGESNHFSGAPTPLLINRD